MKLTSAIVIAIASFALGLMFASSCNKPVIETETILIRDTVTKVLAGTNTVLTKTVKIHDTLIQKEVHTIRDTIAAFDDYYTVKHFTTDISDSSITGKAYTVISKNNMDSLTLKFRLNKPQTIIINEPQEGSKAGFWAGGYIAATKTEISTISPQIGYGWNKSLVTVGYGLNQVFSVSYLKRIGK